MNIVPDELEPKLRGEIISLVRTLGAEAATKLLVENPAVGSLARLQAILNELWPHLLPEVPPLPIVPGLIDENVERVFVLDAKLEQVDNSIGTSIPRVAAPGATATLELGITATSKGWKEGGEARVRGVVTKLNPAIVAQPERLHFNDLPARIIVTGFEPGVLLEFVVQGIAISAHVTSADGWETLKLSMGVSVMDDSPWRAFGQAVQISGRGKLTGIRTGTSNDGNSTPDQPPIPGTITSVHATTFLRNGAKISSHVFMSPKLTDADRQELIDFNAAQGYGVFYLYLANEGDYGKRSVVYRHEDVAFWRKWLERICASGARVIVWMCADDSGGLAKRSDVEWHQLVQTFMDDCGDLVKEWVTGLECDERWDAKRTQALTQMLKHETGMPVGVHTTGMSSIGHAKGADKFYLQCGFGKSPAQIAALVKEARSKFGGPVICAEYHKSGETDEAKAIGDAAIAAGAAGVGNGCTAKGLASLAGSTGGSGGTTPATGLLRSVKASKKKHYITWECDEAVDAWPAKKEGTKSINGWIVVNGVKVEQFRPGYREQHLKNIYGPAGKGEHGIRGIKTGDTVRIALAAKHASDETNVVEFVWPWEPT